MAKRQSNVDAGHGAGRRRRPGSTAVTDSEITVTEADFESVRPSSDEMSDLSSVRESVQSLPGYGEKGRVLPGLGECVQKLESGAVRVDEAMVLGPHAGLTRENVVGTDDRVMIANTTIAPYRSICHLLMRFPSGFYLGTGAFVSENTILTAGHNLFDPDTQQWAVQVTVSPARNGSQRPVSPITVSDDAFRITSGWKRGVKFADVGAIRFNGNVSSNYLGIRSFESDEEDELAGLTVGVVGYPGPVDHPDPGRPNTMWGHVRRVARFEPHRLFYDVDTTGGQSGSPVVHATEDGGFYAVGVHNYGGSGLNIATRISDPLFDVILRWIEGP